jgi:hypothetical protein
MAVPRSPDVGFIETAPSMGGAVFFVTKSPHPGASFLAGKQPNGEAMNDSNELRAKARQARYAASMRTESGQAADRQLIALAIRLERQADAIDIRNEIFSKLRA